MLKSFSDISGSKEFLTPNQELVYNKLVSGRISEKPTEDSFAETGAFSQAEINADKLEIKNLKKSFDVPTMQGEILEAILLDQIENSEYFEGEEYYTIETTKHDDYKNHTDFVIEINNNGKPIRIAVDATVGDRWTAEAKYEKIIKELDFYKGTTIKYFQSGVDPEEKGEIKGLPSTVLMMSKENLSNLCDVMAKALNNEPGSKKNLSKLHLKFSVLEELLSQLSQQAAYLEKKNNTKSRVYGNIIEAKELITVILDRMKTSGGMEDSLYKSIVVEPVKPHALNAK